VRLRNLIKRRPRPDMACSAIEEEEINSINEGRIFILISLFLIIILSIDYYYLYYYFLKYKHFGTYFLIRAQSSNVLSASHKGNEHIILRSVCPSTGLLPNYIMSLD
jgi:hypothetical protein